MAPASSNPFPGSILIVDDEANIRRTLAICLEGEGYEVIAVGTPRDALEEASRRYFEAAFLDLRLGVESGMELLPRLLAACPNLKIIVITAFATVSSAVQAVKAGAFDYLPKPFTPDQVTLVAAKAVELRRLEQRARALDQSAAGQESDFESRSPRVQKALAVARQAAESGATILLRGETGTGKGVLARAIHAWSRRASRPFVTVSCPSLPAELLESELFGHAQGAFTGAQKEQAGRVAEAQGGTLFLDEISELPLPLQPKLLRFVQDREYERLGEAGSRKADVRVIAATNGDLKAEVASGRFREDLFYRLNVVEIEMPPLRERREDIQTLAEGMLARFAGANGRPLAGFTPRALEALQNHPWPGNLRELSNAVERSAIFCPSGLVDLEHLPLEFQEPRAGSPQVGDAASLEAVEEAHMRRVLASTRSLEEAAQVLGVDTATLWRKRKKFGIQPGGGDERA